MRIAFVVRRWWPVVGGGENLARHVAHGLARDHEVTVIAHRIDPGPTSVLTDSLRPPPTFEPFDDGDVRVVPLRVGIRRRLLLAPLAVQIAPGLRRYAHGRMRLATTSVYASAVAPVLAQAIGDVDVVHMWGGDQVAAAAVRAARLRQTPVVITPLAHEGQWGDDAGSAATYRAADGIVALLDTEAALYRGLGVERSRIHVNGVCSPPVIPAGGAELRERLGISGPLVLFLGVRRPYKGVDVLVAAADVVAGTRSDVTVAFVGPGPPIDPARSSSRIIDVGEADDGERAAWLDAADLLCLPSEGEIFPVSILEAWSTGTPVLTSSIPTLRELLDASAGGATADATPSAMADALVDLLSSRDRLDALGRAGHDFWARGHTVEAITDSYERIYEKAIANRSHP